MGAMTSQITSLMIVYSTIYSGSDQRKHQSSASLAFMRGIHRWPVNSPHKGPVTQKMFLFDDIIIYELLLLEEAIKPWHPGLRNANQCLVKPQAAHVCYPSSTQNAENCWVSYIRKSSSGLTTCVSNYIHIKLSDGIIYPCLYSITV